MYKVNPFYLSYTFKGQALQYNAISVCPSTWIIIVRNICSFSLFLEHDSMYENIYILDPFYTVPALKPATGSGHGDNVSLIN